MPSDRDRSLTSNAGPGQAPASLQIAESIRACLSRRTPGASICPSEVARALVPQAAAWRALMPEVRAVAARMAQTAEIRIMQGGRELDPRQLPKGPIRLGRGPNWSP